MRIHSFALIAFMFSGIGTVALAAPPPAGPGLTPSTIVPATCIAGFVAKPASYDKMQPKAQYECSATVTAACNQHATFQLPTHPYSADINKFFYHCQSFVKELTCMAGFTSTGTQLFGSPPGYTCRSVATLSCSNGLVVYMHLWDEPAYDGTKFFYHCVQSSS